MPLRLLWASWPNPELNLAFEWALLELARRGACPSTLRLWVNGPCVVVDRSCRSLAEVRLPACESLGLPVLRRPTAGGAVYHDEGNLNWTVLVRRSDLPEGVRWPREAERLAGEAILSLLSRYGLQGSFRPGEGAFAFDRKISGLAIYAGREAIMVHGTLLISSDLARLREALYCKYEVVNLSELLGRPVEVRGVGELLASCLASAFGAELEEGGPSEEELSLASTCLPRVRLPKPNKLGPPEARGGRS